MMVAWYATALGSNADVHVDVRTDCTCVDDPPRIAGHSATLCRLRLDVELRRLRRSIMRPAAAHDSIPS